VLISQELSKRCIWIQNGNLPPKIADSATQLAIEMHRRLTNVHNDLKTQLPEKHIIRIPQTLQLQIDQLQTILETSICIEIDNIIDEHINKIQTPYCTYGVDRRLLSELDTVNNFTRCLGQNCVNFKIMEQIKLYICEHSNSPLIIYGKSGCGKSVLTAKIAQNIHTWLPDAGLVLR